MKRLLLAFALLFAGAGLSAGAAPRSTDPADSLYQLQGKFIDQDGKAQGLDVHRGHPVLITMFYASCPAACPLIIDTLRATEKTLTAEERANLRIVMVSIDPARDTPQALRALADERHIDTTRWTLLHTDEATVRTIAALLNVQYRKLPSGEFNHSTVITLLSPQGQIKASTSTLGHPDPAILASLK